MNIWRWMVPLAPSAVVVSGQEDSFAYGGPERPDASLQHSSQHESWRERHRHRACFSMLYQLSLYFPYTQTVLLVWSLVALLSQLLSVGSDSAAFGGGKRSLWCRQTLLKASSGAGQHGQHGTFNCVPAQIKASNDQNLYVSIVMVVWRNHQFMGFCVFCCFKL